MYGVVSSGLSVSDSQSDNRRLESQWFEARSVSSLLCCFLRQEALLHILSLHPGVQIGTWQQHATGGNPGTD